MCYNLSAQQHGTCGTVQDEAFMSAFRKNKANWDKTIQKGLVDRFVPVTFHLVAKNDGTDRMPVDGVYAALCKLNDRYQAAGSEMFFYLDGINEINNTGLFTNPRDNRNALISNFDERSMNVFVVSQITGGAGTGNTLGYYSPGMDLIVIQKGNLGDATYTFEHEIGHFFTLAHTHRGWEDQPYRPSDYPEQITFTEINSTQVTNPVRVELVDRSNCQIAGDEICDTDPNYGFGFTCGCCNMLWTVIDRKGDTILTPPLTNIMSYATNCNEYVFSPDQIVALQTSYDASARTYLRNTDVTEYKPIRDAVTQISPGAPGSLETVEIFDDILFDWEDVQNAEFYKLRINGDVIEVTDSEYRAFDQMPNSIVSWSVRAFTKFGAGCIDETTEIVFRTGDASAAISELDFVSELAIYPNPLVQDQALSIKFDASRTTGANVAVFDVAGKKIYTEEVRITTGPNVITVPAGSMESGIHILKIETPDGLITEKILVD